MSKKQSISKWRHLQNEVFTNNKGNNGGQAALNNSNQDLTQVVSEHEMLLLNMLEVNLNELEASQETAPIAEANNQQVFQ